ncbi:MAG: 5-formyltetrahydrofolate cyclo-ligase, partial [Paracoccaceae bacterium]
MSDLTERKQAARKAAFARRKAAHALDIGACAGLLSSVLA